MVHELCQRRRERRAACAPEAGTVLPGTNLKDRGQGRRLARCGVALRLCSVILLSWPLVFLLPRLSFGSVCRAQARALCAGTSVPNQASALRLCSRQPRSWLAVKVFRVAGSHSLPSRLYAPAPPRCCIGRGSRNQQVKSRTADTLCVRTMGACFCRCGAQSSGPFQRSTTTCGKGSRQTATLFRPLIDACL